MFYPRCCCNRSDRLQQTYVTDPFQIRNTCYFFRKIDVGIVNIPSRTIVFIFNRSGSRITCGSSCIHICIRRELCTSRDNNNRTNCRFRHRHPQSSFSPHLHKRYVTIPHIRQRSPIYCNIRQGIQRGKLSLSKCKRVIGGVYIIAYRQRNF